MALGLVEQACLKFSRLRHRANSSLPYHRSRVCDGGEARNAERLKELANERRYVRPARSKTRQKETLLPIGKKKRSKNSNISLAYIDDEALMKP